MASSSRIDMRHGFMKSIIKNQVDRYLFISEDFMSCTANNVMHFAPLIVLEWLEVAMIAVLQ